MSARSSTTSSPKQNWSRNPKVKDDAATWSPQQTKTEISMSHPHDPQDPTEAAPQLSGAEASAVDALFGDRRAAAQRYVEHLCTTGISHGLLGPRGESG